MTKKLIGFTVEAKVSCRCPKGHTCWVLVKSIVPPTDDFRSEQHANNLKLYLESAYNELERYKCETCDLNEKIAWKPT